MAKRKVSVKNLKHKVDKLWSQVIKKIWQNKSGISGNESGLMNSHHVCGKKGYHLRYSIYNGICLTSYEHSRGVHSGDIRIQEKYLREVRNGLKKKWGNDIFERLEVIEKDKTKYVLEEYQEALQKILKELEE